MFVNQHTCDFAGKRQLDSRGIPAGGPATCSRSKLALQMASPRSVSRPVSATSARHICRKQCRCRASAACTLRPSWAWVAYPHCLQTRSQLTAFQKRTCQCDACTPWYPRIAAVFGGVRCITATRMRRINATLPAKAKANDNIIHKSAGQNAFA